MATAIADLLYPQSASDQLRKSDESRKKKALTPLRTFSVDEVTGAGQNIVKLSRLRELLRTSWADELQVELASVAPDWNGDHFSAPGDSVRNDIHTALSGLPVLPRRPEIEIDDDGSVALLWAGLSRVFALTFKGNGRVVATLSPQSPGCRVWSSEVDATDALTSKLQEREVYPIVA